LNGTTRTVYRLLFGERITCSGSSSASCS